ncbi:hypothetical protein BGZ72_000885 [Mortierella alpina]|nr:hypothetical protein BGZ72_000885 [Mortierella alpina]
MAAGNQTRLGFAQQKRGTGRALITKRATNAADGDDTPDDALTKADRLLERVGALSRTMEEKLAAYKKAKEEEKTQRKESVTPVATRSLRSEAKRTRELKPDAAQKTLHESMTATHHVEKSAPRTPAKQLTDAEENATKHSTDRDEEAEEQTASASTSPSPKADSVGEDADFEETAHESTTLDKAVETTEHTKAVAEQASIKAQITHEVVMQDTAEDDEDNIHPLARTVVKSTVLESRTKSHSESLSVNHQTVDSRKAVSTPAKIPPRLAVHDSIAENPSLPLPSHLRTLYDIFKGLETVLVFTKRQGQLCFYHKLKKHVELQSSRNFEIKHLAQFKTILPEGYKYTASPCLFEGARIRSILIDMLDIKDEVEGVFVPQVEKRQRLFLDRLHDRVKMHHQIRQKQLDKKASGQGLATPEEKRQALIASRLPGVFDLIRFKRVDVISSSLLTGQVVRSSKMPISQAEGQESLEMMAKVLPEWCSVFETADGEKYFKVLQTDAQGSTIQHDLKALRARLVAKSLGK